MSGSAHTSRSPPPSPIRARKSPPPHRAQFVVPLQPGVHRRAVRHPRVAADVGIGLPRLQPPAHLLHPRNLVVIGHAHIAPPRRLLTRRHRCHPLAKKGKPRRRTARPSSPRRTDRPCPNPPRNART